MLSGILDNDTALDIREHTSDTHGFTEHLFGLCPLLGIPFMPRLKDLPDQVLSRIDGTTVNRHPKGTPYQRAIGALAQSRCRLVSLPGTFRECGHATRFIPGSLACPSSGRSRHCGA